MRLIVYHKHWLTVSLTIFLAVCPLTTSAESQSPSRDRGSCARYLINGIKSPSNRMMWGSAFEGVELPLPPSIRSRYPNFRMVSPHSGAYYIFEIDGRRIGYLYVRDEPDDLMSVESMDINHDFKNLGLGRVLLQAAILDRPNLKVIHTVLTEDNQWIAERAHSSGMEVSEAIKQTPAYKIRASEGFDEFVPGSIDPSKLSFSVRRSAADLTRRN